MLASWFAAPAVIGAAPIPDANNPAGWLRSLMPTLQPASTETCNKQVSPPATLFIAGWGGSSTEAIEAVLNESVGMRFSSSSDDTGDSWAIRDSGMNKPTLIQTKVNEQAEASDFLLDTSAEIDQSPWAEQVCNSADSFQQEVDDAIAAGSASNLTAASGSTIYPPWAFKEPRTMYYIPELLAQHPGALYVHYVRDIRTRTRRGGGGSNFLESPQT